MWEGQSLYSISHYIRSVRNGFYLYFRSPILQRGKQLSEVRIPSSSGDSEVVSYATTGSVRIAKVEVATPWKLTRFTNL